MSKCYMTVKGTVTIDGKTKDFMDKACAPASETKLQDLLPHNLEDFSYEVIDVNFQGELTYERVRELDNLSHAEFDKLFTIRTIEFEYQ